MTQQSAARYLCRRSERSLVAVRHRGIWSLQGTNLDYYPDLVVLTTLWDQPRCLEAYHLYDDRLRAVRRYL